MKRYDPKKILIEEEDIIHCYRKTNIMSKTSFQYKNDKILLIDFEGKTFIKTDKFNSIMEKITADIVIYVISLTEYQYFHPTEMIEKSFVDSKKLMTKTMEHEDFKSLPWVILFNKLDIFEDKIKKFPLKNYFDDYVDQEPVDFVVGKYLNGISVLHEYVVISMFSPNDVVRAMEKIEAKIQ